MLEIAGDHERIGGLLRLLGAAAGLELADTDGRVTVTAETGPVRSARLRDSLREMTGDDDPRTARVNVDTTRIVFGSFAKWQLLNAVNCCGFEAGAPGMGTVIAIHEIWENYRAWKPDGGLTQYGPAHAAALELEGTVAAQLTGREGGRVAAGRFDVEDEDGYVLDYETYYVVLTPKPEHEWATGRLAAAFHGRTELRSEVLAGVAPGERVAKERITGIVGFLKEHPMATARITGQRTGGEHASQAALRAASVRSALSVGLKEDNYADDTGIETSYDRSKGPGADLGARRSWASPHDEIADDPGVRIAFSEPAA